MNRIAPFALLAGVLAVQSPGVADADPITLTNAGANQQSLAFAEVDPGSEPATQMTNDVNSLPFTTPTSAAFGVFSSTLTSNLTTSQLSFVAAQTIGDNSIPEALTAGEGLVYFTAGANVTYSIGGSATATGGTTYFQYSDSLMDETTNTTIYAFNGVRGSAGTQTLDSSGGPLSGSLTAGNLYQYEVVYEFFGSNTGLAGNTTITFSQPATVPEPSSLAMCGLAGAIGAGYAWRRRKRAA